MRAVLLVLGLLLVPTGRAVARLPGVYLASLLVVVSLAMSAGPSMAQPPAVYLAWGNCAGEAGATVNTSFDCDPAAGTIHTLVGTYQLGIPYPLRAQMVEAILDLTLDGESTNPPFWQMGPAGCNASGLNVHTDRPALCTSHLPGLCPCYSYLYLDEPSPRGGNTLRIRPIQVWGEGRMTGFRRTFAFQLDFLMAGAGACEGCPTPFHAVLNSISIYFEGSSIPAVIQSTDPGSQPCVAGNGAGLAECGATPTRKMTWGKLKRLWR